MDDDGGKLNISDNTNVVKNKTDNSSQKSANFSLKVLLIIAFSLIVFGVLFVIFLSLFGSQINLKPVVACGDGTISGYCSIQRPYFCENNSLIKNATLCGCDENFEFNKGKCLFNVSSICSNPIVSDNKTFCGIPLEKNSSLSEASYSYKPLKKEIKINYTLNNKNESLNFSFNSEVLNYLLSLPQDKVYLGNEIPRRADFILPKVNNPVQSQYLSKIAAQIEDLYPDSKDMQAKAAVALVQDIPYKESPVGNYSISNLRVSRYPYQVLSENQGSCEGKSELLANILKQMGFGVTIFYYVKENHEAVGIKCPMQYSYEGTGYCFVETTEPSPISYSTGTYFDVNGGAGKLESKPEIIMVSQGISLSSNLPDYSDAIKLTTLMNKINQTGTLNPIQRAQMNSLKKRYGLNY